jgi:hypothetical protein
MDIEALRERREKRRHQVRRRRWAVGLILAAATAVAALALTAGGSSKHTTHPTATPAASARVAGGGGAGGQAALQGGSAPAAPVPILMYHVIAAPPAGAPFPGLYVPPEEFAAQMQALSRGGWHAVTLDQVAANWSRGAPLGPGKPIVLSFDNGYNSQYTQALPVLRGLGWHGVENIQRGLLAAGWELDTQGFSHANLVALGPEALHYEVAVARSVLRRRYGVPVNWFCYPSGHYDAKVIAAVQAAGYQGSTTVIPGWAQPGEDRYRLHRLRVLGGTTPDQLLALVNGVRADPPAPASYTGG